jgi:hypothetical protein
MADPVPGDSSAGLVTLVSGILSDAQQLIRQEAALARREIQDELAKARAVAFVLGLGVALAVVGGILLGHMLVQLLFWATAERLALWVCFTIVGSLFLAVAVLLLHAGRARARTIDIVPRQTVAALKENVPWTKSPQ